MIMAAEAEEDVELVTEREEASVGAAVEELDGHGIAEELGEVDGTETSGADPDGEGSRQHLNFVP